MNRGLPLPVLAGSVRAGAGRGAGRTDANPVPGLGMSMVRLTDRLILTSPIRPTPRTPDQERRALHVHSPSAPTGRVTEAPAGGASPIATSGPPPIVDTRLTMLAPKRAKKPDSSFPRRTKSSGPRSVTRGRRPRHRRRRRDQAPLTVAIGARSHGHPAPMTPMLRPHREPRSAAVVADGIVLVRDQVAQVPLPVAVAVAVLRTEVARATGRVRRVAL